MDEALSVKRILRSAATVTRSRKLCLSLLLDQDQSALNAVDCAGYGDGATWT